MKDLTAPSPSRRLAGICIAALALTLVFFHSISNAQKKPLTVSVCDLVDSPIKFNGKYVSVRAQVSSDGIERTNLRDDSCPKGVALWIPQEARDDPEVAKLENALHGRGSPGTMGKQIEGTFEGRFERRRKGKLRPNVLVLKHVFDLNVEIK